MALTNYEPKQHKKGGNQMKSIILLLLSTFLVFSLITAPGCKKVEKEAPKQPVEKTAPEEAQPQETQPAPEEVEPAKEQPEETK